MLSTILKPKIPYQLPVGGATEKTLQNGQNLKKWKIEIFRHWCTQGTWKCAYNHYLGCWTRFCSLKYRLNFPSGWYWKNFAKWSKSEKMENWHFFDSDVPQGPESVPITMIWSSEHDSAVKTTLAIAFLGATEKTWENVQNLKKWKIDIFRHCCAQRTWKCACNHDLEFWAWFCSQNDRSDSPLGCYWKNLRKWLKSEKVENRRFSPLMYPRDLKVCP